MGDRRMNRTHRHVCETCWLKAVGGSEATQIHYEPWKLNRVEIELMGIETQLRCQVSSMSPRFKSSAPRCILCSEGLGSSSSELYSLHGPLLGWRNSFCNFTLTESTLWCQCVCRLDLKSLFIFVHFPSYGSPSPAQGDDAILGVICIGQDITQMKEPGWLQPRLSFSAGMQWLQCLWSSLPPSLPWVSKQVPVIFIDFPCFVGAFAFDLSVVHIWPRSDL